MIENKFCVLCGEALNEEGNCPKEHVFKKMCINCAWLNTVDGNQVCTNSKNMENARKKILDAARNAAEGYSISNLKLDLNPLPLKKPTLKCGEWLLSELVLTNIKNSFK